MQTKHDSNIRKLSIGEASQRLGVHPDTLRRWEAAGRIESTRTLGNQRRYDEDDIDTLAAGEAPQALATDKTQETTSHSRATSLPNAGAA